MHPVLRFLANLTFFLSLGQFTAAVAAEKPNIVLILADDLGWADLPLYGNRYHETPALDRLAAAGLRFTQFYSGAVCSPTRANIQSGRHEARFGITQHIPGHRRPFAKLIDPPVPRQLPLEVETFAEHLAAAGYATGYFGKWHLGGPGYGPQDQGWQVAQEFQKHELPPSVTGTGGAVRTAAYLGEKAAEFIEANREKPFVLQISHYAVHIPLSTTPELLAKYRNKAPMPGYPSLPEYAGLLEELDDSVAAIVAALEKAGIAGRTLVVFVSDNGGLETDQPGNRYTSNLPLRSEKGTLYEGGIRVPAIMSWPGTIPAGTVCDAPAVTTDLYATFLEVAGEATLLERLGAGSVSKSPLDGVSLLPVLRNPAATLARGALFWHLPHYHHSTPASAVRQGRWKLIEFFEDNAVELYDLDADPGESNNLAAAEAGKAAELKTALAAWRARVGARLPQPNPAYDPERAGELAKGNAR
jgi:arylsulfatase A